MFPNGEFVAAMMCAPVEGYVNGNVTVTVGCCHWVGLMTSVSQLYQMKPTAFHQGIV